MPRQSQKIVTPNGAINCFDTHMRLSWEQKISENIGKYMYEKCHMNPEHLAKICKKAILFVTNTSDGTRIKKMKCYYMELRHGFLI